MYKPWISSTQRLQNGNQDTYGRQGDGAKDRRIEIRLTADELVKLSEAKPN